MVNVDKIKTSLILISLDEINSLYKGKNNYEQVFGWIRVCAVLFGSVVCSNCSSG